MINSKTELRYGILAILGIVIGGTVYAQSASAAKPLSGIIQSYGGWGLSAVLMIVIVFMYRHIIKLYDKIESTSKGLNDKFFVLMEQRITTDHEYKNGFEKLYGIVKELIARM